MIFECVFLVFDFKNGFLIHLIELKNKKNTYQIQGFFNSFFNVWFSNVFEIKA